MQQRFNNKHLLAGLVVTLGGFMAASGFENIAPDIAQLGVGTGFVGIIVTGLMIALNSQDKDIE